MFYLFLMYSRVKEVDGWRKNAWLSVTFYFKVTKPYVWTFLFRALNKVEQCFFECIFGQGRSEKETRDLVLQGHATLWVTFPIPCTIQARAVIFFVSNVVWVKEVNGVREKYLTLTRDLEVQGHVWRSRIPLSLYRLDLLSLNIFSVFLQRSFSVRVF